LSISALEGAITDIQRSSDGELQSLRQRYQKLGQRHGALEAEIARAQGQLAKTEQEVQEGTQRVAMAKTSRRTAREALDRERNVKHEELQQCQRSVNQRSEQHKALERTGEDIRKRMLRNVEEAKAASAKQVADADERMHMLRSEFSTALDSRDREHSTGVTGNRDRLDNLARENEQLRRYVGEHRHAATHIQDVGSQMQKSLASMEDRAAELRRDQLRR